jgi:polysaccharide deacetylase family protein (PEP-CTERM system associated)
MNKNILSVDVEEWFHPEALQHLYPEETWDSQEQRIEKNVELLLDLFAEKEVTATFFIIGWAAQKHPQMVRKIISAGHEVANHSNKHNMVTKLTPEIFHKDIVDSQKILQDISGQKVIGYRAPTFSVVKETFWAWEILLEQGFKYDSSVYPILHDRYGEPGAPRKPYIALQKDDKALIEFPMPAIRFLSKNFPFGGGGYLRIFPLSFTSFAVKKFIRKDRPAIIYAHPWEFDTGQPKLNLGKIQTWRHYYNIKNNLKKLSVLLERFEWTSFKDYIEKYNLLEKLLKKN